MTVALLLSVWLVPCPLVQAWVISYFTWRFWGRRFQQNGSWRQA